MSEMDRTTAYTLLDLWVQRITPAWNMNLGYRLVAQERTKKNWYARCMRLSPRERQGEPIREEDVVSVADAKELIRSALPFAGFSQTKGDWVMKAWKYLRRHDVGHQI